MLTLFNGSHPVTVEVTSEGKIEIIDHYGHTIHIDSSSSEKLVEYLGYGDISHAELIELEREHDNELSKYSKEVADLQDELDDMESERDRYRDRVESLEGEIMDLKDDLNAAAKEIEYLEKQIK